MFLVFALRKDTDGTLIRPISARYMHKKEIALYDEKIPTFTSNEEAERFVETADLTD